MREAIRYLGYGRNTADERTRMMIEDAFSEVEKAAGPKSICRIFDVNQNTDGRITIENMEIDSRSLSRNLKGCVKIVLFGATLGAGIDHLIRRTSLTDMSRAVIQQACAATLLEEYCDEKQLEIGRELEQEGCICVRVSARDTVISIFITRNRSCGCWIALKRSD